MTGPTEETDGSYAGTLRCSKTASFLEMTLIVVKRTHPESFRRTGAVDTYVDDGDCPGCWWRPSTLLTESAPSGVDEGLPRVLGTKYVVDGVCSGPADHLRWYWARPRALRCYRALPR